MSQTLWIMCIIIGCILFVLVIFLLLRSHQGVLTHKAHPAVSDLIDYALLVEDNVVLLKSGGLMSMYAITLPDLSMKPQTQINHIYELAQNAMLKLNSHYCIHIDVLRTQDHAYLPFLEVEHPVLQDLEARRSQLFQKEGSYHSELFLTITLIGQASTNAYLEQMLIQGSYSPLASRASQHKKESNTNDFSVLKQEKALSLACNSAAQSTVENESNGAALDQESYTAHPIHTTHTVQSTPASCMSQTSHASCMGQTNYTADGETVTDKTIASNTTNGTSSSMDSTHSKASNTLDTQEVPPIAQMGTHANGIAHTNAQASSHANDQAGTHALSCSAPMSECATSIPKHVSSASNQSLPLINLEADRASDYELGSSHNSDHFESVSRPSPQMEAQSFCHETCATSQQSDCTQTQSASSQTVQTDETDESSRNFAQSAHAAHVAPFAQSDNQLDQTDQLDQDNPAHLNHAFVSNNHQEDLPALDPHVQQYINSFKQDCNSVIEALGEVFQIRPLGITETEQPYNLRKVLAYDPKASNSNQSYCKQEYAPDQAQYSAASYEQSSTQSSHSHQSQQEIHNQGQHQGSNQAPNQDQNSQGSSQASTFTTLQEQPSIQGVFSPCQPSVASRASLDQASSTPYSAQHTETLGGQGELQGQMHYEKAAHVHSHAAADCNLVSNSIAARSQNLSYADVDRCEQYGEQAVLENASLSADSVASVATGNTLESFSTNVETNVVTDRSAPTQAYANVGDNVRTDTNASATANPTLFTQEQNDAALNGSTLGNFALDDSPVDSLDAKQQTPAFNLSLSQEKERVVNYVHEGLSFLHRCITGKTHPINPPVDNVYLDAILCTQDYEHGMTPKIGEQYICVLALEGLPHSSTQGLLDQLSTLPFAYRFSTRFVYFDKLESQLLLDKYHRFWSQKTKGILAQIFNIARPRLNKNAVEKIQELESAQKALDNHELLFGSYTANLILMNSDLRTLNMQAMEAIKVIENLGFSVRVETVNATEAFLGSLPGHYYENLRRSIISQDVLVDLIPISVPSSGEKTAPCPLYGMARSPLMQVRTDGMSSYLLNLHDQDLGNTLVIGPPGSGKSVLLGSLMLNLLRYRHMRIFAFDQGYSFYALTKALGGKHVELNNLSTQLCPLDQINTAAGFEYGLNFLNTLYEINKLPLNPLEQNELQATLKLLEKTNDHYSLSKLHMLLATARLKGGLQPYLSTKYSTSILDGTSNLQLGKMLTTFECQELFKAPPKIAILMLKQLFHLLEREFNGNPAAIVLDEAWLMLQHPTFASEVIKWFKTLRKYNVVVLLATQSLSDLEHSQEFHNLLECAKTRFYLANYAAESIPVAQSYAHLGLSPQEIYALAHAHAKRDYFFVKGEQHVMFKLMLSKEELRLLSFAGAQAKDQVELLYQKYGPAFYTHAY